MTVARRAADCNRIDIFPAIARLAFLQPGAGRRAQSAVRCRVINHEEHP